MLNWVKKLLGGAAGDASLPTGDQAEWAKTLQAHLEGVREHDPKAPVEDLVAYVCTGEPVSALAFATRSLEFGQDLGFHYGVVFDKPTLAELNRLLDRVPVEFVLRWGKLLAAAAHGTQTVWHLSEPGGRHWLEALLLHFGGRGHTVRGKRTMPAQLSAQLLEAALVADGADADTLVRLAFTTSPPGGYGLANVQNRIDALHGLAAAIHRHVAILPGLMHPAEVAHKVHCLELLDSTAEKVDEAVLVAVAPAIAEHATSSSKQVRAAAEPLLQRNPALFEPHLRKLAVEAAPTQRKQALKLLASLARERADEALLAFARDTAAADQAASVRELVAEWAAAQDAVETASTAYEIEVPVIDWRIEMTPELDAALEQMFGDIRKGIDKSNAEAEAYNAQQQAAGKSNYRREIHTHRAFGKRELCALLASDAPRSDERYPKAARIETAALVAFAKTGAASPACMAKVLAAFGHLTSNDALAWFASECLEALHARTGRPTLLELRELLAEQGVSAAQLLSSYCSRWHGFAQDWPSEHVWPFFAAELPLVLEGLRGRHDSWSFDKARLFAGLATLPTAPAELVDPLFDIAFGSSKTERLLAQQALDSLPDKQARIELGLQNGKADVRATAAQWLQRIGAPGAVPSLEKAIAKEKNDVVKGALLDALEALGCAIEKYLDRDRLRNEAEKGLQKGLPKELAWLPVDVLPQVRWRDSGAPVAPQVLQWLCVQACKQKTPEPNIMLRKYCAMFERQSAAAFAQTLLETWLAADITPISPESAQAAAMTQATQQHGWMQQSPQYYKDSPDFGLSVEELYTKYLPRFLKQPAGSVIASKGVLALVAACGDGGVAAPVQRYLKEWFGHRAAQGKALIAMLAWVEHPSATQLMLSVGNRFRTKGFQDEAMKQAQALAERRGWTLAELADRTMPAAGFDEHGVLELAYGARTFTAHLLPDFKVELRNPDGKKVSALPEPRADEDAELARQAKKQFTAAKKEIKSIATLQTERLYEALCTERDWSAEDWQTYLRPHPIVRHLLQRLVWVETVDGTAARVFRPLDDGTLTDIDDEALELRPGARVRLAHDTVLDAAAVAAWQQHLADYEITPLFQQLGKGTFALPETKARDTAIDDFRGHVLEAFALRGRAGKLGYSRGTTEDGGWFFSYEKRFPTLGLTAVIEFTGSPLPEENRTVALKALQFRATDGRHGNDLLLGDVPKVLLSECYQDLRLMAAEGTGFAEDWEKRTEY